MREGMSALITVLNEYKAFATSADNDAQISTVSMIKKVVTVYPGATHQGGGGKPRASALLVVRGKLET